MLPGFRFLFAATLLTLSLVVFGLGAAALLRASHERFASLPSRPATAPQLLQLTQAATPTLSMLRVEVSEPSEPVLPLFDTLLPTDRIATLNIAPRVEDALPAMPTAPELQIESKPEMKAEISSEPPKVEIQIEPKAEPAYEPPVQSAAIPAPPPVEVAAVPAPTEPATVAKIEAHSAMTSEPASQVVAALSEPGITGTVSPPAAAEPLLINAKPIRKPPVPKDRPAAADIVAALPDPAVVAPAVSVEKPIVRPRRTVVKRAAKPKRRSVSRPSPQSPAALTPNPASPFGASPFGT